MRGVLEKVFLLKISEVYYGMEGESINMYSYMNEGILVIFVVVVVMVLLSLGIVNV